MSNEPKFSINIVAVANGYIVSGLTAEWGLPHVFESFEALKQWLNAYLPIYPVYLTGPQVIQGETKRKR